MGYWDKALAEPPPAVPAEPWDSGRFCAPDPAMSPEDQLSWYRIFSHCVLLNVSESCRRNAAVQADHEHERRRALVPR